MGLWKKIDIVHIAIYFFILCNIVFDSTANITIKLVRVMFAGLFLLYFFQKQVINQKVTIYLAWVVMFFMYCVIGCFFAYSKSYAANYTITLAYVSICNVALIIYMSKNLYLIENIMDIIIIGAIIKSIYIYMTNGFLTFLSSRHVEQGSANTLGFYCAIACVFSIYKLKNSDAKLLYTISFVGNIIFMILSASRKAFVFLAVPIVLYFILQSKNPVILFRNITLVILSGVAALFLIMNVDFLYNLVGNRIETMIYGLLGIGGTDASTTGRLRLISDGMDWYKERPIFGHGLSNFKALHELKYPNLKPLYAHNNYIELLVDCGIVGTVIYYSIHLYLVVSYVRNLRRLSDLQIILFGCLLAILICDYGMVSYFSVFTQMIILLSYMCINIREEDIGWRKKVL